MAELVMTKLKDALAAIDQKLEFTLAEFKQRIHSENPSGSRPAQHSHSGLAETKKSPGRAAPALSHSTSKGSDTNSGPDRYSQQEPSISGSMSSESDLNSS
jgi:hypothetical protein